MANSRSLQPEALTARLLQSLEQLAACGEVAHELTVAFSGGMDSTVLLYLLSCVAGPSGWSLRAVHVHHGLNAAAEDWVRHCEHVCTKLRIPLQVERVSVVPEGRGLEDAARQVRHAALQEATPSGWIVLAHHADDQAETLLQRLVRGTGVAGAAAMRPVDAARRLWRPLLDLPRETLRCWAMAQGLAWIEDDSNTDESLSRNFFRHRVLSPVKQHFPSGVENIARACRHFEEAAALLQELAEADAEMVGWGNGARRRIRLLSDARIRNLLRHWIVSAGALAPSAVRLEALRTGLSSHAAMRWEHQDLAVCAYHEAVWLEPADQSRPVPTVWHGEPRLPWGKGWISFTPGTGPDVVRLPDARDCRIEIGLRQGGEALQLASNRPHRSLKHLFQEKDVPPWARSALPVVRVQKDLVWVGAVGCNARWLAGEGKSGWRIEWHPPAFSR